MPANRVDIAIFGGGIAGLWLLNRLRGAGFNAVLFERAQLGAGQSIAAQGMLHGGIKYSLGGRLSGAATAISSMPERWQQCLDGEGEVDLRGVSILADHMHLWPAPGVRGRLGTLLAGHLARSRVTRAGTPPPPLEPQAGEGVVLRLEETVIDVPDLLRRLAITGAGAIFRLEPEQWQLQRTENRLQGISISLPGQSAPTLELAVEHFVFAAGAGNESLLARAGARQPAMQRRPLHQVLVRHDYPHPLYGHCIGPRSEPRLTVSSHRGRDGRWVWYLGGELATRGVSVAPATLIERARRELTTLLPGIALGRAEWRTLAIDRAEPRQRRRARPDQAFVGAAEDIANATVAWPTKLTLTPDLADRVHARVIAAAVPASGDEVPASLQDLPVPTVAEPSWITQFD